MQQNARSAATIVTVFTVASSFVFVANFFMDRRTLVNDAICAKADSFDDFSESAFKYKGFCVIPNVMMGKMQRDMEIYSRITLIVHASADYLDRRLVEQVHAWDGPVSLSVFLPKGRVAISMIDARKKLDLYRSKLISKLSVHFFFEGQPNCTEALLDESVNTSAITLYPANVARNIARLLSTTKYILIGDYEFLFSRHFEKQMRTLADSVLERNPKTALVFRIFEVSDTVKDFPRSKSRLHELYKKGEVVEFHARYYSAGHTIPGLEEWFSRNVSEAIPTLSAPIPYSRYMWEPQFVSLTTIPFHDENFPYPIRDNTVLRWEMCRMNYTFRVVDNVFMVHRGIKTKAGNLPSLRSFAMPKFLLAVKKFAYRMERLYPTTKAFCPTTYGP